MPIDEIVATIIRFQQVKALYTGTPVFEASQISGSSDYKIVFSAAYDEQNGGE